LNERGLDSDLDQVRRADSRLATAASRIPPGAGEVTQRTVVDRMGARDVGQHLLCHQLRPAVGIDRLPQAILADGRYGRNSVSRGSAREDEMRYTGGDGRLEQRATLDRVVVVVGKRLLDRLRHDNRAGEMHDRSRATADPLLGEDPCEELRI